jgi:hypothetical protein
MELFLASWHGPRAVEPMTSEQVGSTTMPAPLRRFYDVLGGWRKVVVQNVVLHRRKYHISRKRNGQRRTSMTESSCSTSRTKAYASAQRRPKTPTRHPSGYVARRSAENWAIGNSRSRTSGVLLLQLLAFRGDHGRSERRERRLAGSTGTRSGRRTARSTSDWPVALAKLPRRVLRWRSVLAFAGPNPGPDETESTAENLSLALAALDSDALAYLDVD